MPLRVHVALLGLMGSGKSAVGERLAHALRAPFVDLDARVVAAHGPIEAIFREHGEPGFRERERAALAAALLEPPGVLSTGGGVVTHEPSRLALRASLRVYLEVPPEQIVARLRRSSAVRPLVGARPTIERVEALYAARREWYEQAEIRVPGVAPIEAVAQAVRAALLRHGCVVAA